jgi:hypothetical protein
MMKWPCSLGLLAALALGSLCAPTQAAAPGLSSISPRGIQRGTETVVTFSGVRLGDVAEVLFYSPGISVAKIEKVNDNTFKATLKAAPDCALGEHVARVRTASGISEMRTLWVGALPSVAEKEPNNDLAAAQKVPLNVTVEGVVQYEDVDYYAVELKKGQRLSAEVEGMRLGTTLFDPFLAILDGKRFELATSDDTPLNGQDGLCSIIAPADGTYYVMVRESSYQGSGACQYRLHIGTFPRPLAVLPAGGKAGEEVEVTFLGDPAGPIKQKVKVPSTPGATMRLHCQDGGGISPSGMPFRVSAAGNVLEAEPNDDHKAATPAAECGLALNGVIGKDGDVDCFRFKGKKGQTFDIHCYARRLGSPLDSVMTLSVAGGGEVASSDDVGGPDSYFRYTFPDDRDYVLTVTDHLGKGGSNYFYRVELTPVAPSAVLSIPKVALYSQERQALAVPRGGRMATLVNVARRDFGGDITLGAEKLPAGVTMSAEGMIAALDTIPVVFEARPDAPVGGSMADLKVTHADPKHPAIASRFYQMAELITGPPGQSTYWKGEVGQLAAAVTEEAPFSIDIVEPKVPLLQNGSMGLRVVATRKPGFTGPITVRPLWSPPGVSTGAGITIPTGATEGILPMNAAANAMVRKWKTAVVAVADAGKGPVWTSSQLATIEVAQPFLAADMQRAAVEQGKEVELLVKIRHLTPFEGKAQLKLLGLPFKATAPDVEVDGKATEAVFRITVDKTTPAGNHRNLFCQVTVTRGSDAMVANSGYSELRVDVPIPPKTPVVVAKPPDKPPVVTPTPPTPPKRLTRLEQLRKEQEEREKAEKEGKPLPPPAPKK